MLGEIAHVQRLHSVCTVAAAAAARQWQATHVVRHALAPPRLDHEVARQGLQFREVDWGVIQKACWFCSWAVLTVTSRARACGAVGDRKEFS